MCFRSNLRRVSNRGPASSEEVAHLDEAVHQGRRVKVHLALDILVDHLVAGADQPLGVVEARPDAQRLVQDHELVRNVEQEVRNQGVAADRIRVEHVDGGGELSVRFRRLLVDEEADLGVEVNEVDLDQALDLVQSLDLSFAVQKPVQLLEASFGKEISAKEKDKFRQ